MLTVLHQYVDSNSVVDNATQVTIKMKTVWRNIVRLGISAGIYLYSIIFKAQETQETVYDPLSTLIALFHDPLLLMHKRNDKLLDYDCLQHDLYRCTEAEKIPVLKEQVILAKR